MVCIISVMLGVATLIVVNSVMGGFSAKLRTRLHQLLSDVVVEAYDHNGFANPQRQMDLIRSAPCLDSRIEAMAPTLEIFAMIQFNYRGNPIARPIRLVGVEVESRSRLGGFAEHLVIHPNRATFGLSPEARKLNEWRNRSAFQPPEPVEPPAQGEKAPPEPPPSKRFVP